MKKNKIDIVKICLIMITIAVLGSFLMFTYYNVKHTIYNHDERKSVCDSMGEIYLESIQSSNELIKCCEVKEGEIVGCWDYLN